MVVSARPNRNQRCSVSRYNMGMTLVFGVGTSSVKHDLAKHMLMLENSSVSLGSYQTLCGLGVLQSRL